MAEMGEGVNGNLFYREWISPKPICDPSMQFAIVLNQGAFVNREHWQNLAKERVLDADALLLAVDGLERII